LHALSSRPLSGAGYIKGARPAQGIVGADAFERTIALAELVAPMDVGASIHPTSQAVLSGEIAE